MRRLALILPLFLAACATAPLPPTQPKPSEPPAQPPKPVAPPEPAQLPTVVPAAWSDLPDWSSATLEGSWKALQQSCRTLAKNPDWSDTCLQAAAMPNASGEQIRAFFEQGFQPWKLQTQEGKETGLITGYYEPKLTGSLQPTAENRHGIYGPPDDMIAVDLASVYPELKSMRLRGRVEGRKLVPYHTRAELNRLDYAPLQGKALAWVADPVELAFLQIQGSGRIELPDGKLLRVGYADQNGHPWKSMGRWLIDQGEIQPHQASMQTIQAWAAAHPERIHELLNVDPSYVFFRILPNADGGPLGAQGVPLTDGYSIAVDPRFVPLGAPVYLATTWPNSNAALNRLMLAQDTGGAIRGPVRADFFWGFGAEAGQLAGRMKQQGRLWLLWPTGKTPPGTNPVPTPAIAVK